MEQTVRKANRVLWALLALVLVLNFSLPAWGAAPPAESSGPLGPPAESPEPLEVPELACLGAILLDYDTGEVYYEKESDTARPIASMTKVMTLYLVFEEIAAGHLTLNTPVLISDYAAAVSNDPRYSGLERLTAGRRYKVNTLIRLMMVQSCNGSAIALAEWIGGTEAAFVERMNATAAAWGIDAHFADCTGFEDRGNAVSPRAVAELARRILTDYPQVLDYSSLTSVIFKGKTFAPSNTLLLDDTMEGIDGLKTGTTNGAGCCFVGTALREGRRMISVVLGAPSHSVRMEESRALLDYGFACRAERDAYWDRFAQALQVTFTADDPAVWPYAETTYTAAFSGLEELQSAARVRWELNGQSAGEPVETELTDGAALSLTAAVAGGGDWVRAAAVVTLPNGVEVRREARLPVATVELTFTSHPGWQRAKLAPDSVLGLSLQITCDQGRTVFIPAGWYLDGEPIPRYQNSAFRLSPDGGSSYTLFTGRLPAGRHLLEFRCNPDGLPGARQTSFALDILLFERDTLAQIV